MEGDVTRAGLGSGCRGGGRRLRRNLDPIVNSSGPTDFNPDVRDALATNTDAAMNILEFGVRGTEHAVALAASFDLPRGGERDGAGDGEADLRTTSPRRVARLRCRTGIGISA